MRYRVSKHTKKLEGRIILPSSKSISNRLLIMQALGKEPFAIHRLSDSEDTRVLQEALASNLPVVDIGHAGTAMRFSTAYFSLMDNPKTITGSPRMKQRPIAKLVDALRGLGAGIEYLENEGFPPVKTTGHPPTGSIIEIDGSISSQYITALLLIAPCLPNGLEVRLLNEVISASYIRLTLELMAYMGIEYTWKDNLVTIAPCEYQGKDITVEADWSGASYWYQAAALSSKCDLVIEGLQANSMQGDSKIAGLFEKLGVFTSYGHNEIRIWKESREHVFFEFDFIENPDMVQTFAATLVMLDIPFVFHGTQSLRIKETDRIAALQAELAKFGANLEYKEEGTLSWDGKKGQIMEAPKVINTYDDHRMALAFAPLATREPICILDPSVVKKSYGSFWSDLKSTGFSIREIKEN